MTKDHNTEQAVSETDALMTAIQEFASTYSLAGGRFDDGTMHDQAMAQKEEIRKSLYAALSQVRGKAQEPVAVVYPPDGTVSPFTVINLGLGAVQMGDCIHDNRLHALWFGKNGKGMGHEEQLNRAAHEGETLAVVTFSNVEGLDVLMEVLQRVRVKAFPAAAPQVAQEEGAREKPYLWFHEKSRTIHQTDMPFAFLKDCIPLYKGPQPDAQQSSEKDCAK